MNRANDRQKYLRLLGEKYPTQQAIKREIINLTAILNLPKGTEHFMSDLHGEFEAFCHILNNCSGVIREKAESLYGGTLPHEKVKEICTLIYYPVEKLRLLKKEQALSKAWYREILEYMIEIARVVSSKYTRSKVRKAMPDDYAYIIDELLHAQKDEDGNQVVYHEKILETIIRVDADNFVIALADLIKRLAVDRLHIVGDIFDRGESAEMILDLLMNHHALDIEWGNHDILWMGAACGSEVCIAKVLYNCLHYRTLSTLESGYGISLRELFLVSQRLYPDREPLKAALAEVTVLLFKLEGQMIKRNPDYKMNDRLLLHKIDFANSTIDLDGAVYPVNESCFPTVDPAEPYALSNEEKTLVKDLKSAFVSSLKMREHTAFLFEYGGMYKVYNGNLLYHGCVPLDEDGRLSSFSFFGESFAGKAYFDMAEQVARQAFITGDRVALDFMYFLHCGEQSPLCGRKTKTFERAYINDSAAWRENKNPYYIHYYSRDVCEMILAEFGLNSPSAHIINGHTPVRTGKGELPIRAEGKLLVIDGGFCEKYHETTGIAGYTLIYNSHGMRLKAHHPFRSVDEALNENRDMHSDTEIVETEGKRVMVGGTDIGEEIKSEIADLYALLGYKM